MSELNDHELSKPFQAAGHHAPERDLTARIMARVAVTPIHRPAPVKPLIGGKGWLLIAALLALPLVGTLITGLSQSAPSNGFLASLQDLLAHVQLTAGPWPAWVIGASAVALVLVLQDRSLSRMRAWTPHANARKRPTDRRAFSHQGSG